MTTRLLKRLWFAAVALVILVGFALQFYLLFTGGADANSGEAGNDIPLATRFIRLFSFFTILSNVLVLVVAVFIAAGRSFGSRVWRVVYLDALLSILVTGTIFPLLLAPGLVLRDAAVIVTNLFHLVSPILFVAGWLLFGPRRLWSWRLALLAFIWPVAWLVYTFIHGAATNWYPYPVLDAGVLGFGPALVNAGFVVVYAAVLTVVVLVIDRFVPSIGRERVSDVQATIDG